EFECETAAKGGSALEELAAIECDSHGASLRERLAVGGLHGLGRAVHLLSTERVDGLAHAPVRAAAAQVRDPLLDVFIGGLGILRQQGGGGHDHAALA